MKKRFMLKALDSAKRGILSGEGGPFGACIVTSSGKVIALSHNTVLLNQDPTCHAEMNAIREAARRMKSFNLRGCQIYSTTEPCPMCFSAIHWANIKVVFYGTKIKDVQCRGFNELSLSAGTLKRLGNSPVTLARPFMRQECLALLRLWDSLENKLLY